MGYIEGLLGGFAGRKHEVEKENIRQADLAATREHGVYAALMNADDPEVRALALSGLLDSANPKPKKSGLKGWLGEREASPVHQQLLQLLKTPTLQQVTEPGPPTLGSTQTAGMMTGLPTGQSPQMEQAETQAAPQPALTTPQGQPNAGMSPNSPVQPGGAPPTPVSLVQTSTQSPPTPTSITRMAMRQRQPFLDPGAKLRQVAEEKEIGDITGMRAGLRAAGFDDQTASDMIRTHVAGRYASALPYQHIAVEMPDGNGGYFKTMATYDRRSGQYQDDSGQPMYGARPVSSTASSGGLGTEGELVSRMLFGKHGNELNQQEAQKAAEVMNLRRNQVPWDKALTHANSYLPNGTNDQKIAFANWLTTTSAAPTGGPPPAPGAAAAPAASPAAATTAPATAPEAAGAPTGQTAAPATPSATPPPVVPSRPGTATLPPELGAMSNQTGKVAPVKPMPESTVIALARSKTLNAQIDDALAALTPFKDDNTLEGSIRLAAKYRSGQADPLTTVAIQSADVAGLQAKAATQLGTGRSVHQYIDRGQHVPRVPSGRQVILAGHGQSGLGRALSMIPGTNAANVNDASQLRQGDAGGFDTPKMMYEKLVGAKRANSLFIQEVELAHAVQPALGHEANGAPPAPTTVNIGGVSRKIGDTIQWQGKAYRLDGIENGQAKLTPLQ